MQPGSGMIVAVSGCCRTLEEHVVTGQVTGQNIGYNAVGGLNIL